LFGGLLLLFAVVVAAAAAAAVFVLVADRLFLLVSLFRTGTLGAATVVVHNGASSPSPGSVRCVLLPPPLGRPNGGPRPSAARMVGGSRNASVVVVVDPTTSKRRRRTKPIIILSLATRSLPVLLRPASLPVVVSLSLSLLGGFQGRGMHGKELGSSERAQLSESVGRGALIARLSVGCCCVPVA
jgi:hypothetical protein